LIAEFTDLQTNLVCSLKKVSRLSEFSGYDYDIQAGRSLIKNSKIVIPESYKYKTNLEMLFGISMNTHLLIGVIRLEFICC